MRYCFYDRNGKACFYAIDNGDIYSFDGSPLGYIYQDKIYSIDGYHLGNLEKGWVIDKRGYPAYFEENSGNIGLVKPIKHIKSIPSVRHIFPVKGIRKVPSIKPVTKLSWSDCEGTDLFD